MIDLRQKALPNTVNVGGKAFLLKTDFREWIKFGKIYHPEITYGELFFLFDEKAPNEPFIEQVFEFYININLTPASSDNDDEVQAVDFIEDGEYIVSAFLQVYGIDLTEIDYMHWHKFQALFRSLPDTCKMSQIMSYRLYQKSNKTQEQMYAELRDAWTLPDIEAMEKSSSLLDEFNKL